MRAMAPQNIDITTKALEVAKFVQASPEVKKKILLGYATMADAIFKLGSAGTQIIEQNKQTFLPLLADNVVDWVLSEIGSPLYSSIVQKEPQLGTMFSGKAKAMETINHVRKQFNVTGDTIGFMTLGGIINQAAAVIPEVHIPEFEECEDDQDGIDELGEYDDELEGDVPVDTDAFNFDDNLIDQELEEQFGDVPYINEAAKARAEVEAEEQSEKSTASFDEDAVVGEKIAASKHGQIKAVGGSTSSELEPDIDISGMEVPDDVDEMVASIMSRIEAVFRSCLELDRPYGMLYDKGMLSYKIGKGGVLDFTPGVGQGSSIFERLFTAIQDAAGAPLNCPHDLRMVPNCVNIRAAAAKGMTNCYFAGFTFKYALGVVDGKPYKSWNTFKPAAKESIKSRLMKLVKEDIFYNSQDLIENSFSNSILVLSYDKGMGLKLRISLPGTSINHTTLERNIRSIKTYNNSGITISNVAGCNDVIDVQILLDESKFLNKPSWAYKMMQVKIDNQEPISLIDGLPMGRKANGEVIDFKLDPSSRFLTFIAAGSGAGKGVLTLSVVAGALGSNVPVFYMDFKPDMAPIFWAAEKEYNINTFSYDAMLSTHKDSGDARYSLTGSMPRDVAAAGMGGFAGAIMYLKSVQLMCAMAKFRTANTGSFKNIMFVFDETQAMQKLIKGAVEMAARLKKEHKPKTVKGQTEPGDSIYVYCDTLLNWFNNVDINISTYINTTGRKSSTFCIFIAQNPDYSTWNNMIAEADGKQLKLLSGITMADTICKILGKGSTTSKYGLGGDGKKNVSAKEFQYVANNRFFGIYDGKTTDGASITIFKPFLTLNTDNPKDACWTNGIGGAYGYGSVPEGQYLQNIKEAHPGDGQFSNEYGVHTGTGLVGLTSMYCLGDEARVAASMQSSWQYCLEFFAATGLNQKYNTPSDYMYDLSLNGLMMIDNMVKFSPTAENSVLLGLGEADNESEEGFETDDSDWVVQDGKPTAQLGDDIDMLSEDGDDLLGGFGVTEETPAQEPVKPVGVTRELSPEQQMFIRNKRIESTRQTAQMEQSFAPSDDISPSDVTTGDIPLDDGDYFGNSMGEVYVSPSPDIEANNTTAATSGGPTGKFTNVRPSAYNVGTILNSENSIDCKIGPRHFLEAKEPIFYKSLWGTKYEFKRRWDAVLKAIGSTMNKSLITRVALVGQQMYVNKKIVNMQNVIGGYEDIRLENIIDFKQMFKEFPNLEHLTIDFDILQRFQLEQPDLPTGFFAYSRQLLYVTMISDNKAIVVDRNSAQNSREAQELYDKADTASKFTLASAVRSPRGMDQRAAGRNGKIWATTKSYSSRGFQAAANQLKKDNPGIIRAALYGSMGLAAAAVGGITFGVSKILGLFGR